jgi:hypothetical protein
MTLHVLCSHIRNFRCPFMSQIIRAHKRAYKTKNNEPTFEDSKKDSNSSPNCTKNCTPAIPSPIHGRLNIKT